MSDKKKSQFIKKQAKHFVIKQLKSVKKPVEKTTKH